MIEIEKHRISMSLEEYKVLLEWFGTDEASEEGESVQIFRDGRTLIDDQYAHRFYCPEAKFSPSWDEIKDDVKRFKYWLEKGEVQKYVK